MKLALAKSCAFDELGNVRVTYCAWLTKSPRLVGRCALAGSFFHAVTLSVTTKIAHRGREFPFACGLFGLEVG